MGITGIKKIMHQLCSGDSKIYMQIKSTIGLAELHKYFSILTRSKQRVDCMGSYLLQRPLVNFLK